MQELKITKQNLNSFRLIIDAYADYTKFPKKDNWKKLSKEELWIWMVNQIIVVGGSAASKRFHGDKELLFKISLSRLKTLKTDAARKRAIHEILRRIGARYAGRDIDKCAKTKALLHNFNFLVQYKGGPKGLMKELAALKGSEVEWQRVAFLMTHLKFFKSKSARDFLMNVGLNQQTIAIDIRIQNIFHSLKIQFPSTNELAKPKVYDAIEKEIREKICQPLGIEPIKWDRIMYQHYFKILKHDYLIGRLF